MKLKMLSIIGILAICICNTASAEYLINNNGEYLANPNHEKMEIHNNKNAKDPTFAEVIKILKETTIDENEYSHTYYCTEFTAILQQCSYDFFCVMQFIICFWFRFFNEFVVLIEINRYSSLS